MQHNTEKDTNKVVMVTGAAQRIGAAVARTLHSAGLNLILHYRTSQQAAQELQRELNTRRADSAELLQGDLLDTPGLDRIIQLAAAAWGRLDVLVNNAAIFYPAPIGAVSIENWEELIGINLKAPFFLSQAAAPYLAKQSGCIVNITDIHAERPLRSYPVYSIAKAGLVMLTKALAGELGPAIRVNAVAPGAILWPRDGLGEDAKRRIISHTFLKRQGDPEDIARAVLLLIRDAGYITGQVLAVDGGRSLDS